MSQRFNTYELSGWTNSARQTAHRQVCQRFLLPLLFLGFIFTYTVANADTRSTNEPATNTLAADVETAAKSSFDELLQNLTKRSFKSKAATLEQLQIVQHSQVLPILRAMMDGKLYYRKQDKTVVIVIKQDNQYRLFQASNQTDLGLSEKKSIKKISTNNSLRKLLRTMIAGMSLSDPDSSVRYQAAKQILKTLTPESESLLRNALAKEEDEAIASTLRTAIALLEADSPDKQTKLNAIEELSQSLETVAQSRLRSFLQKYADGGFVEPDKEIRQQARSALNQINTRLDSYKLVETVFFGLSLGSVLLLAAIGLAITFGVMGVINMAHGELIMLGAYTTYILQQLMPNHIGLALVLAIPAAFLVSGLFGIVIERSVIRHLYGRPLETLLATFGISLVLQQLVRSVFSPLNRSVESPSWLSGAWEINSALALTYNRLYIIIFSLLVFAGLILILKKTALGLQVRAVSQNRNMAKALGVRSDWIDALTFGLGAGIAGIAGVALSQLTNVGPNMGQAYIIDSFMVVVFGGVGNLWGTLVGAMSLGVVNKFLEPYSGAVMAKILVLVFIILFIQKRPKGLFPQKGRAAEH